MKIGVEEAVDHRLAQKGADEDSSEFLQVMAGVDQCLAVRELDAVDPFERHHAPGAAGPIDLGDVEADFRLHGFARSEEHTSELKSLMSISVAVLCLKKKNKREQ